MFDLMIALDLLHGLTLFIAILFIAFNISPKLAHIPPLIRELGFGLVLGTAALIGMMNTLELMPGVIFDVRNVIVALAAAFGGPLSGLVSAIMVSAYRFSLGGIGTAAGIGSVVTACLLGIAMYRLCKRRQHLPMNIATSAQFGLVLALFSLAWFLPLPPELAGPSLAKVALPTLFTFPLSTVLLGMALQLYQRHAQIAADLESERALLNNLINAVPDYIFVKDRTGRFTLSNIAHAQAAGARPDSLINRTAAEFFPNTMAATYDDDDRRVLAGQRIVSEERQTIDLKGRTIWVSTTKVPLRERNGQISGVIGISRDITSRKDMEQQLREKEEHFRAVFESIMEGIVVQDQDGHIVTCNKNAESILGLTHDQMLGRSSVDSRWRAIHEDGTDFPGEEHPAMVTLRTREAQRNVMMGVHKPDGSLTWIMVNAQPMFAGDTDRPSSVVTTFLDVTERKLADQQALELDAHQQRIKVLQQFVSNVSHDLRTPLTIINNSVYMLGRMTHPEQQKPRLSLIEDQVQHISRILDMFSQFLTLTDENVLANPVSVDLNPIVEDVVLRYAGRAAEKHQTLLVEPYDEACTVFGETEKLRQVVAHLVENALNYTPEGGTVKVSTCVDAEQVMVVVQDTGIGIPSDEQQRIFEEFYRVDQARALETGGSGLGLAIVKNFVQVHHGKVYVESQPGSGSAFHVTLPHHPVRKRMAV